MIKRLNEIIIYRYRQFFAHENEDVAAPPFPLVSGSLYPIAALQSLVISAKALKQLIISKRLS